MKIITIHINKGGTGKSTISYNLASWIAEKENKKVLLVDGDHSCNLSFSFPETGKSTILDVFQNKEVELYPINKNLDLLKGSKDLRDDFLDLKSKQNNCMIMFMWIADNLDKLEKYDYMIIDTHNEPSLVTNNFIAVSDIVLGVSEPSRNGFRAWLDLEDTIDVLKSELLDVLTRKSYVNTEPFLIGNRLEHNTNSSKYFLDIIEKEPRYLGMIQKKELLAKSLLENTNVFSRDSKIQEQHKEFYKNTEAVFSRILDKVNNK